MRNLYNALICLALACTLAVLSGCSGTVDPAPVPDPAPTDPGAQSGVDPVDPAPAPVELDATQQLLADIWAKGAGKLICVVEYVGNDISFFTTDGEELGSITVGVNPAALAATADGSQIYVANYGNGEVIRITFSPVPKVERLRVGTRPMALALDEREHLLYIADYYLNSIRILDTELMSLIGSIAMEPKGFGERDVPPDCCFNALDGDVMEGRRPVSIALTPDGTTIYCANIGTYDISVLDTVNRAELEKYDGVIGTRDVLVSSDGKTILLCGVGSDLVDSSDVIVMDAATGAQLALVPVGKAVSGIAWEGDTLVAASRDEGTLSVIDPTTWTVTATMQLEEGLADVALSADGKRAYVGNSVSGDLVCVDLASLTEVWRVTALADPRFVCVM